MEIVTERYPFPGFLGFYILDYVVLRNNFANVKRRTAKCKKEDRK